MPFETDLSCELKDLKKANRARMFVLLKSNWLFILVMLLVVTAAVSGPGLIAGDATEIISVVTFPFVMLLALFIATDVATKMVFNKYKAAGIQNIHYTFYDDEFQMDSSLVKNTVRYDALRGIDENRDYFFLKVSSSKVLVVQKQNCSPELIAFLREKEAGIKRCFS